MEGSGAGGAGCRVVLVGWRGLVMGVHGTWRSLISVIWITFLFDRSFIFNNRLMVIFYQDSVSGFRHIRLGFCAHDAAFY